MNRPKISFIVAAYNAEKTIRKCLESICNQTLWEIEIICVNDGSSDETKTIIQEMAEADPRIVLLDSEENVGTLLVRKKGVMEARGEYIILLDSDDYFELNAAEIAYEAIREKKVDILMYGAMPEFDDEEVEPWLLEYRVRLLETRPERIDISPAICEINRMNLMWNKIVEAELCKKAYQVAEDIHLTVGEDTYICWVMHYYANSFDTISNKLYHWHCEGGVSTTGTRTLAKFDKFCSDMHEFEEATYRFFDRVDASEVVRNMFENGRSESKNARRAYVLSQWRKNLAPQDLEEGFNCVCKYFDRNEIYAYIASLWNTKEKNDATRGLKIQELGEEIRSLRKEVAVQNRIISKKDRKIEKLESSASMRIGRTITAIPRKIKRILK